MLEKIATDEVIGLFEKLKNNVEFFGILKVTEQTFKDWDNEEGSIYDNL